MSDEVKKYLVKIIDSKIDSLNIERVIAEKIDYKNARFKVAIWSQNLEYSLNRDFTGTLSEVIKTAESEFKKQNKIKRVTADTYLVHIYLGDKERDVPEELVRKYRKL